MRTLLILAALCLPISASGCAHLNQSCATALPLLSQGNVLINDAQDALAQAQTVVSLISDEAKRQKAEAAIAEARSALRVTESMLHAASEACTAPDLPSLFQAFAQAWEVVRSYLSTFGGAGGPVVADPKAYLMAR